MGSSFQLFGISHLAVFSITVLVSLAVVCIAGRRPESPGVRRVAWGLVVALAVFKVVTLAGAHARGILSLQNGLPMHLCDWAVVAAVLGLVTRRRTPFELAYFWGLAGTVQALLTPDLDFDFPDVRFVTFFGAHAGVVVAVVFMVVSMRLRPERGAVARAMAWSNGYLAVAALVNWVTQANYGYLCAKPVNRSLLDHLGPWPLYIVSIELLALTLFLLLYAPWMLRRRMGR